jgi:hypothetical protein
MVYIKERFKDNSVRKRKMKEIDDLRFMRISLIFPNGLHRIKVAGRRFARIKRTCRRTCRRVSRNDDKERV